jgi:2-hydroxychromene-2-carboxylate isomerase
LPAGDEANLSESLRNAGQQPDRVLELAASDSINLAYQDATSRARTLGIFGSPSFVVDGLELFWGDDRLEDAIDYSRRLVTPS